MSELFEEECYAGLIRDDGSPNDPLVVVDVGANVGLFAAWVATQPAESVQLYGFEPVPTTYAFLEKNLERLSSNVAHTYTHAVQTALSDSDGTTDMLTYPNDSIVSSCSNSKQVTSDITTDWLLQFLWPSVRKFGLFRWLARGVAWHLLSGSSTITVPTLRLSSWLRSRNLRRIDALKIDVEGHEWSVLQGIDAEDWPKIQSVVVECENAHERIVALFRKHGFVDVRVETGDYFKDSPMRMVFAHR